MARTKGIRSTRHRSVLKAAKGFRDARQKRIRAAKEAVLHAKMYAYIGRKTRKRDIRRLWITRLNAAAREGGLTYSQLVTGLKKANVELNRKILADIAVSDSQTFNKIIDKAKKAL